MHSLQCLVSSLNVVVLELWSLIMSRSHPLSTTPLPTRPILPLAKTLLISSKPANPPIPPSLLAKAPHLSAHQMIPAAASPKPPSKEDEAWLGDTVPVSPSNRRNGECTTGQILVIRRSDKGDNGMRWGGKKRDRGAYVRGWKSSSSRATASVPPTNSPVIGSQHE